MQNAPQHADDTIIGGMTLHQIMKLQRWWFAQGRSIADIDKPMMVRTTGVRKDPEEQTLFQNGDIKINDAEKIVFFKGNEIKIPKMQYKMLKYFIQHAGLCLELRKITFDLWNRIDSDANQTVRVFVADLRKIFGDEIIVTKPGFGYIMPKFTGEA